MIFAVYGIRLRGSTDVRYIGQTGGDIRKRLTSHFGDLSCAHWGGTSRFAAWLYGNRPEVEVFAISQHPTREGAKAAERTAIQVASALGHDLFNRHHLPRSVQTPGVAA